MTLETLRNGCCLGWNSIILSLSDIFQQNFVVKFYCMFCCFTVVYNFMQKSARIAEISTTVSGSYTLYNHPVHTHSFRGCSTVCVLIVVFEQQQFMKHNMRHFIASRTKFCPRNKKDVTQLKTSNCILQDTICKKNTTNTQEEVEINTKYTY